MYHGIPPLPVSVPCFCTSDSYPGTSPVQMNPQHQLPSSAPTNDCHKTPCWQAEHHKTPTSIACWHARFPTSRRHLAAEHSTPMRSSTSDSGSEVSVDWYDDEFDSASGSGRLSDRSEDDADQKEQWVRESRIEIESYFRDVRRCAYGISSDKVQEFLSELQREWFCEALSSFFDEDPDREREVLDSMLSLFSFERTILKPESLLTLFTQEHSNSFAQRMVKLLSYEQPGEAMMGLVETANRIDTTLRKWDHTGRVERAEIEYSMKNFQNRPGQPVCDFYMEKKCCGFGPDCRYHHPLEVLIPGHDEERDNEADSLYLEIKKHDRALRAIESCTQSRSEVENRSRMQAGGQWLEPRKGKTSSEKPCAVDSEAQDKIKVLGLTPPKDQIELHELCARLVNDRTSLCAEYIATLNDRRLEKIATRMSLLPDINSMLKPIGATVQRSHTATAVRLLSVPAVKQRKTVTSYKLVTKGTPASQSYAVRPGLIAHCAEAYYSYFEVEGYKVENAKGVALNFEESQRRASLHLVRLFRLQNPIAEKLAETRQKLGDNRRKARRSPVVEAEEEELAMEERRLEEEMKTVAFGVEEHACESVRAAVKLHFFEIAARHYKAQGKLEDTAARNPARKEEGGAEPQLIRQTSEQDCRLQFNVKGPWTLILTEKALADLRELYKSQRALEACMNKLQRIEAGEWGPSVATFLNSKSAIPLYEAKPLDNVRILWQVDVGFCSIVDAERQVVKIIGCELTGRGMVLKVWTILSDHKEVQSLIPRLADLNNIQTKPHIRMAKLRNYPDKNDPIRCLPFGKTLGAEEEEAAQAPLKPADCMSYAAKYMKLFPMSEAMVVDILSGRDVHTLHNISMKEASVINSRTSSIVKGRSGTGKTTCIVFRMLALHQASKAPGSASCALRQIFVTKSVDLCTRVSKYFAQLCRASTAGPSANSDDDDDDELFVADDDEAFAHLPASVTDLDGQHFPAFVTFDKLFEMIEAAVQRAFRELQSHEAARGREVAPEHVQAWRNLDATSPRSRRARGAEADGGLEVEFDRFAGVYWKALEVDVKRRFEPTLVWAEMQGLIKGSEQALPSDRGYLTREQYTELSPQRYPAFAHDRERLYELFLNYEQIKTSHGDWDGADRVHWLWKVRLAVQVSSYQCSAHATAFKLSATALWHGCAAFKLTAGMEFQSAGLPAVEDIADELYVDEVQDLSPSRMHVLLSLLKQPGGFFMGCGDTAQTITKGSSFRFSDLSAMYYRDLEKRGVPEADRKLVEAQLEHNYRSHNGILRLAASVVHLLYAYFPGSVDKMQDDRADYEGRLPLVVVGNERDTWEHLFQPDCGESSVEFGAEQAVLVRTEKRKEDVMKLSLKPGFVGTVTAAKGLEFRDVMLLNFFRDSPVKQEWRVFLEQVREKGKPTTEPQAFDLLKHSILAAELKELYTAITRPRTRLWIVDEDIFGVEKHPILQFWEAGGMREHHPLVDFCDTHDMLKTFSKMASNDTPADWVRQGTYLLKEKHYDQAEYCFIRAGEGSEANAGVARSFKLRAEGDAFTKVEKRAEARQRYIEAAHSFETLPAKYQDWTAKCFAAAGEQKKAGDVLVKLFDSSPEGAQRPELLDKAYDHYENCGAWLDASGCRRRAGSFDAALACLKTGKLYVEGMHFLAQHAAAIPAEQVSKFASFAFLFHLKKNLHDGARSCLRHMDTQKREHMLKTYGCVDWLVETYIEQADWLKAASLLKEHHKWVQASQCLDKAGLPTEAAEASVHAALCAWKRWSRSTQAQELVVEVDDVATILGLLSDVIERRATKSSSADVIQHKLLNQCLAIRAILKPEAGSTAALGSCVDFFHGLQESEMKKGKKSMAKSSLWVEAMAWEYRCLDWMLDLAWAGSGQKRGLWLVDRVIRMAGLSMQMLTRLQDAKKDDLMVRVSDAVFSVLEPSSEQQFQSKMLRADCWGRHLLGHEKRENLTLDTWKPEAQALTTTSKLLHSVSEDDMKRGMARYLANRLSKLLREALEHFGAPKRLLPLQPCPVANYQGGACPAHQWGKCTRQHAPATRQVLAEYLQVVSKLAHVAQLQAVLHRHLQRSAHKTGVRLRAAAPADSTHAPVDHFADTLSNAVAQAVLPTRRKWFENLVLSLQSVDSKCESSRVVAETVQNISPDVVFGLVEMVSRVWLKPGQWRGASVAEFLRAVMLLFKLRPENSDVIVSQLLKIANQASPRSCFSFYAPARCSFHAFGAQFWSNMETGALSLSLEAGGFYLQFLRQTLLAPGDLVVEAAPHPIDLVELLETFTAVCLASSKVLHGLVLPAAYIAPVVSRPRLCEAIRSGIAQSQRGRDHLRTVVEFVDQLVIGGGFERLLWAVDNDKFKRPPWYAGREMCVRLAILRFVVSANIDAMTTAQKEQNLQQFHACLLRNLRERLEQPPELHTDANARPRLMEREEWLGPTSQRILERLEKRFKESVDGLVMVLREDFDSKPEWSPAVEEKILVLEDGTVVRDSKGKSTKAQSSGENQKKRVRKAKPAPNPGQEQPSAAEVGSKVEDSGDDRLTQDNDLHKRVEKQEGAVAKLQSWYRQMQASTENEAAETKEMLLLQELEPLLQTWSSMLASDRPVVQPQGCKAGTGADKVGTVPEVMKRMFRCRALYRWKVPKVMLELKSTRTQLSLAYHGITKQQLRDNQGDGEEVWDLAEQTHALGLDITVLLTKLGADGNVLSAGPTAFDPAVLSTIISDACELEKNGRDLLAAVDDALGWNRKRN